MFTLIQTYPTNQICLDMGASPGGWTWVLAELHNKVFAIDRAPLDKSLMESYGKNIEYIKSDAFNIDFNKFSHIDWLFCDVICYPEKLYEFIIKTIKLRKIRNFICSLKFKGETDFDVIENFNKIEGSQIIHLFNNKHELTWIKLYKNE